MSVTLSIATATAEDAEAVAGVRNAAAEVLTRLHGRGHWSGVTTVHSVLRGINTSRVLVARNGETIVGTLRLAPKRPWAIDPTFFADSRPPLYLVDMAVAPAATPPPFSPPGPRPTPRLALRRCSPPPTPAPTPFPASSV